MKLTFWKIWNTINLFSSSLSIISLCLFLVHWTSTFYFFSKTAGLMWNLTWSKLFAISFPSKWSIWLLGLIILSDCLKFEINFILRNHMRFWRYLYCKNLSYLILYKICNMIPFKRGVLDTTLCDKVRQWLVTGQ